MHEVVGVSGGEEVAEIRGRGRVEHVAEVRVALNPYVLEADRCDEHEHHARGDAERDGCRTVGKWRAATSQPPMITTTTTTSMAP